MSVRANTLRGDIAACPAKWVLVRAFAVRDYVPAPLADSFRFVMSGHLHPFLLHGT